MGGKRGPVSRVTLYLQLTFRHVTFVSVRFNYIYTDSRRFLMETLICIDKVRESIRT